MLLFIAVSSFGTSFPVEFQYISCYCLSLISISYTSWLTSFQYISCYCLSTSSRAFLISSDISIHLMLLFIVLLVDSLPCPDHISIHLMLLFIVFLLFRCHLSRWISIHLMLLFIQLLVALVWTSIYFNTSHVTVYQCKGCRKHNNYYISIHLMLLFIGKCVSECRSNYIFQYISCYCLSHYICFFCI